MGNEERLEILEKRVAALAQNVDHLTNSFVTINSELLCQIENLQEEVNFLHGGEILHISTKQYKNAGDIALSDMVKRVIQCGHNKKILWTNCDVKRCFNSLMAEYANKNKAVVIGGGGLFFQQSSEQAGSWQWNVSNEVLEQIKVPLFVFAVGYNQFRGQGELSDSFREDINKLAENAEFIGLRNYGSLKKVMEYVRAELHSKLVYQPCPTTIISKLNVCQAYTEATHTPTVAVNLAFDRWEYRFSTNGTAYLEQKLLEIINILAKLSKNYRIRYYAHCEVDKACLPWFERGGISYELVDLSDCQDASEVYEAYQNVDLVIGMRGHAQMIPFGMGIPILSIISHDKMQWFLEDIVHPEWGIDICEEYFGEKLYNLSTQILDNTDEIKREIKSIQDKLYQITMNNVLRIQECLV